MLTITARGISWPQVRLSKRIGAHTVVLAGMVGASLLLYAYIVTSFGHTFRTVDGYLYYTHVHSWYFDGDCDYRNDIVMAPGFKASSYFLHVSPSGSGLVRNPLPCAWAVFAAPFVAVADGLTIAHNAIMSTNIARDGYSPYYRAVVPLGHVLLGIGGLLCTYLLVARYFSKTISALATAVVWCGTNVMYFVSVEPTMTHASSMAMVTLALWAADTIRRNGWSRNLAIGLGFGCGMMVAVRHQNIMWMAAPAVLLIPALIEGLIRRRAGIGRDLGLVVLSALVAAICFVPQIAVNLQTEGAILGHATVWMPHWLDFRFDRELFAPRLGLVPAYPLTGLCLIGVIALCRRWRENTLPLALLAGFVGILYINASWPWAHSPRRYVCGMAVFAMGLAAVMQWAQGSRRRVLALAAISVVLCVRSFAMIFDPDVAFV